MKSERGLTCVRVHRDAAAASIEHVTTGNLSHSPLGCFVVTLGTDKFNKCRVMKRTPRRGAPEYVLDFLCYLGVDLQLVPVYVIVVVEHETA